MPYPNFHSARVESPKRFKKGSFRNKTIAPGVEIIAAKHHAGGPMKVQAYRFDKNQFTPSQARDWLKRNKVKYQSFEKARGTSSKGKTISSSGTSAQIQRGTRIERAEHPRKCSTPEQISKDHVRKNKKAYTEDMPHLMY